MIMYKKIAGYVFPDAVPRIQASCNLTSTRKDIIVVLAWGGAKQRNLRKLLDYYRTKDVTVVSCVMPSFAPSCVKCYFEQQIALSVQEIKAADNTMKESNLLAHVFSNNGAWTFSTLCRRKDLPSFDKLLLDSAPAFHYQRLQLHREVNMISRVLTSTILQRPQYQHPFDIFIKSILYLAIPFGGLMNHLTTYGISVLPNYLELNRYMRDESPVIPTLFVYSIGDKLVPFEMVKDFKNALKGRGVPTTELVFGNDVAHTASFFIYPEEYTDVLQKHFDLKELQSAEEVGPKPEASRL